MPNLGADRDIIDNHSNLAKTEELLGHKLSLGTKASKAKYHNEAKDTPYDFAPKLDSDIIHTQKLLPGWVLHFPSKHETTIPGGTCKTFERLSLLSTL